MDKGVPTYLLNWKSPMSTTDGDYAHACRLLQCFPKWDYISHLKKGETRNCIHLENGMLWLGTCYCLKWEPLQPAFVYSAHLKTGLFHNPYSIFQKSFVLMVINTSTWNSNLCKVYCFWTPHWHVYITYIHLFKIHTDHMVDTLYRAVCKTTVSLTLKWFKILQGGK